MVDDHTPVAELIDRLNADDRDPPIDRASVDDALGPAAGPDPLTRAEVDLIAAGCAS